MGDENRQQEQDHAAQGEKRLAEAERENYRVLERRIRGRVARRTARPAAEN
jgi:hypothetical protein